MKRWDIRGNRGTTFVIYDPFGRAQDMFSIVDFLLTIDYWQNRLVSRYINCSYCPFLYVLCALCG
jgi:hypothetical protein